jgi:hypothetical protein
MIDFEKLEIELKQVREMVQSHAVGVANVYKEVEKVRSQLNMMKSLQDRMEGETLPIDEVELKLRIKSYPMNIRVFIEIETNFGDISEAFDFPPTLEDKLSGSIQTCYFKLLNELYDAHKARGGHFPGDGSESCKEWMDKNGRTVIKKEPCLSRRFSK